LKRKTITACIVLVIALLFLREAAAWARFDWKSFAQASRNVRIAPVIFAAALIYLGYLLRALRWQVLMRPLKNAPILPLFRSTIVGFAALAMLGRPAEFVRPYLIAREEALSMSSQLAIWTLERIFDLTAAGVLVVGGLLASPELRTLPYMGQLRRAVWVAICLAVVIGAAILLLWRFRSQFGTKDVAQVHRWRFVTAGLQGGIQSFNEGLKGLRSPGALACASVLSLMMWVAIALAYLEVVHACPLPLSSMNFAAVLVLMGFSLAGSLIQLPGGGAAQLLVVAVLSNAFSVPVEMALTCGILLWLATYMAPVPVGLILLRKQQFSLRSLARASGEVDAAKPISEPS
jgi:uncharacterized membrane protein YbhN (UPF0104 family)